MGGIKEVAIFSVDCDFDFDELDTDFIYSGVSMKLGDVTELCENSDNDLNND